MNPDIKKKWVDALRSGKYQQGFNYLKNFDNTFCCLGVLCDLYAKETNKGKWEFGCRTSFSFVSETEFSSSLLPPDVKDWASLELEDGGNLDLDGTLTPLIVANDVNKLSFDQIAQAIEDQL